MSFILLGIINSQVEAEAGGAYELIATQLITTNTADLTFSSIPQTYKHLQIRYVARGNNNVTNLRFQLNGDTGSNYANHSLWGSGSAVFSDNSTSSSSMQTAEFDHDGASSAGAFSPGIFDFLDYSSSAKNTTMRGLAGRDGDNGNVTPRIRLRSAAWFNTAAVTSLTVFTDSGTGRFVSCSRFSLYGIKG
jgi:hypothetical protein